MPDEKIYQLAVKVLPGVGDVLAKNLIAYCGSAKEVFQAKPGHLAKIPGIGKKILSQINHDSSLQKAEEILAACEQQGIAIHHYTDDTYPTLLKQAADAPQVIFTRGQGLHHPRMLAIVGTRNATEYGRNVTNAIVEEAQSLGVAIVSGLAYGIDITAHKASLKHGLITLGVLAGGLDHIYPAAHKNIAEQMCEKGALISENPPGTQAQSHFFPARNRIIAGMCEAVIIVEAAKKGGALITAHIGNAYNRDVFAVPGDLKNKYSEGCNYLIRNQQALIYTGVDDLKYHLNWYASEEKPAPLLRDYSKLSEPERNIVLILDEHPSGLTIDELSWRTQISVNQLAAELLNLEFQSMIQSLPGKRYKLA